MSFPTVTLHRFNMITYLLSSGESTNEVEDVAVASRRAESNRQQRVLARFAGLELIEAPHATSVQELVFKRITEANFTNESVVSNQSGVNLNGVWIEVRCDLLTKFS